MNDYVVIYPRYLNAAVMKEDGRRIGKQHCVPNPTIQDIIFHARAVYPTLDIIEELDKRYCRSAVEAHDQGRIRIKKPEGQKKYNIMLSIGNHMALAKREAEEKAAAVQNATQKKQKKK